MTKGRVIAFIVGVLSCLILLEIGLYICALVFVSSQEKLNKIALQKAADYRVLCLGDSTTAIGGKASWPSQLEEVLNSRNPGRQFSE